MKALLGAFNQEKALVGAFSVNVKTGCETDGSFYSTNLDTCPQLDVCTTWRDTRRCDHGDLCCLAHPPPGIEILER